MTKKESQNGSTMGINHYTINEKVSKTRFLVFMWLLLAIVLPKVVQTSWFHYGAGKILQTAMPLQLLAGLIAGGVLYLAGALGLRKARVN